MDVEILRADECLEEVKAMSIFDQMYFPKAGLVPSSINIVKGC
jgi:hypothetical protein